MQASVVGTCRTHRSLTFGSIFFGMVRIVPTHKDAASNLGHFTQTDGVDHAAVGQCGCGNAVLTCGVTERGLTIGVVMRGYALTCRA